MGVRRRHSMDAAPPELRAELEEQKKVIIASTASIIKEAKAKQWHDHCDKLDNKDPRMQQFLNNQLRS